MEKLRLPHLSSPRGSPRLSLRLSLLTLLPRIRYAYPPFSDRTRRRRTHSTSLQVPRAINCSIQRTLSRIRRVCRNGERKVMERGICLRQRLKQHFFCRKLALRTKHLSNKCHVSSRYRFNRAKF